MPAHGLEHDEGRDQTRIGPEVVAEVVVTRMLAAERGPGLGHDLLDERVPDPRAHRRAAVLAHCLGDGLGTDEIVDDRRARTLVEHADGHQRGRQRTGDRPRLLVDKEHTVGITVEGETDVGTTVEDSRHEVFEVLGLDGISGMVGKCAVEFAVQHLELHREPAEDGGDHEPTHTVGRVGHDLERSQRSHVDERTHVVGEVVEQIERGTPTSRIGRDIAKLTIGGQLLDAHQTRLFADRFGTRQAELDAVVLGGIV